MCFPIKMRSFLVAFVTNNDIADKDNYILKPRQVVAY